MTWVDRKLTACCDSVRETTLRILEDGNQMHAVEIADILQDEPEGAGYDFDTLTDAVERVMEGL